MTATTPLLAASPARLVVQLLFLLGAGFLFSQRLRQARDSYQHRSSSPSATARSAISTLRESVHRHLWGWLAVIACVGLAQVLWYLLLVFANVSTQHYSFWNEPPPRASAHLFAQISITVYFVGAIIGAAYSFGTLSAYALEVVSDRRPSLHRALALPSPSFARTWWWATPLFMIAAIGTFFIVTAPAVAQWARLPPRWITNRTRPGDTADLDGGAQSWRQAMSVLGVAIGATTIGTVIGMVTIVSAFDGPIEATAWLLLVGGFVAVALLAAALATAGAKAELS